MNVNMMFAFLVFVFMFILASIFAY